MKSLIIFTFYLISGPVDCSDVIGYSGGSVTIISKIKWYDHNSKYICKVDGKDCTDIIRADTKRRQVQNGRFKLYSNSEKFFIVLIRRLKPQDAGTYRFGLGNQSNSTVNLKVLNDPCCAEPNIKTAYLGQNITITCNYPVVYERNKKFLTKLDDDTDTERVLDTEAKFQNGRFSISDDRSAKVLSVNISDVREADEVFYLFGVWKRERSVSYYSYFAEMYLHVTVRVSTTIQPTTLTTSMMTSAAHTETQSGAVFLSSSAIISVCVCVSLLLMAGFVLMIYKLKCKTTQGSTPSSRRHLKVHNKAHSDNENDLADLPMNENQNLDLDPNNQTDSIYECLDPETQINSVYNNIQS